MKALILEDDEIKSKWIRSVFEEQGWEAVESRCASDCCKKLRDDLFDILVMDLMVPWDADFQAEDPPDDRNSKIVLSEISKGECHVPGYVVGITQDKDLWKISQEEFFRRGWMVIHYQEGVAWKELLKERINYAALSRRSAFSGYGVDIAVVTVLHDPETVAFLDINEGFTEVAPGAADIPHYRGMIGDNTVLLFTAPEMGVSATASITTFISERYKPRVIVMCGIAAGIDPSLKLGDVVIAQKVWDYSSGKIVEAKGFINWVVRTFFGGPTWSFKPTTNSCDMDSPLAQWIASLRSSIGEGWWYSRSSDAFSLEMGPVACGPWVVGNRVVADWLLQRERKLVALEMEFYGLYYAAKFIGSSRLKVIGIKGISDFADPHKNSNPQARLLAARNSARVLRRLVELGLIARLKAA